MADCSATPARSGRTYSGSPRRLAICISACAPICSFACATRSQETAAGGDRTRLPACSILDVGWIRQIKVIDSIFFLASGVFYNLEETQINWFLVRLADAFPGSEILFDACSPRGIRVANRKVIRAGHRRVSNPQWGLDRAKDLPEWNERIVVLAE
jgi:O-methyltransferase involved in polyketide biosynthesis